MQANLATLTPADLGILAAAFDDAIAAGYGDDDTVGMIEFAARAEAGIDEAKAPAIAYAFFRKTICRN